MRKFVKQNRDIKGNDLNPMENALNQETPKPNATHADN